jgi:hypothetical protein
MRKGWCDGQAQSMGRTKKRDVCVALSKLLDSNCPIQGLTANKTACVLISMMAGLAISSPAGAACGTPSIIMKLRTHRSLNKDAPIHRAIQRLGAIASQPVLGGLHHQYCRIYGRLPIYPMFGRGLSRLQPAYVEDVAEAIARAPQRAEMHAITFECGGPRVYSYKELLRAVAHEASLKPMLIPIPFAAWHALAWFAEMLPIPPVTRNQVELMQVDNVSSPEMPG